MMTESIEAEALATASEVIGIFVDERLMSLPLPDAFWSDAYVLGFLMCAALQLTQGRHGDDLSPLSAAEASFQALGELSGQGPDAIKDRVGELQNGGDPDYLKAMLLADKLVRFIAGTADMQYDPLIVAARKKMQSDMEAGVFKPDVPEDRALKATLMTSLFTDVVRQRYGPDGDSK